MKKWLFAVGLGLMAGSAYAACVGPFCWDDTGASIAGYAYNGNGQALVVLSSTSINGLTPYIGQEVMCNTCANAGINKYMVCVATSTTQPAFVMVSSSSIKCQ